MFQHLRYWKSTIQHATHQLLVINLLLYLKQTNHKLSSHVVWTTNNQNHVVRFFVTITTHVATCIVYSYDIVLDKGNITYKNLKRNKKQLFTVTASTADGETVSKNFTFASKYSEGGLFCDVKLLNYNYYRQEVLSSVCVQRWCCYQW